VKNRFGIKVFIKKLQICKMPKAGPTKAQKDKQRRQSRGPEEIVRVQELQNAAY
jgi:hypothetical protein